MNDQVKNTLKQTVWHLTLHISV